jgi:hypothetical protein
VDPFLTAALNHGQARDPTTSNRHREPVTNERTGAKP